MGGKRNRRAGHNYERKIAQEYRDLLSDEQVLTSRYASRKADDEKVDIVGVPMFNLQCKYMKQQPDFYKVLGEMPNDSMMNLIHYKRNIGKGGKTEEVVVMKKSDWFEVLKMLKSEKII